MVSFPEGYSDAQPNANNQVLIEKETIQNLNERPREGLFSSAGVYVSWRKINHRFSLGAVQPRLTDTRLIRTLHYYGQFALYLGKEEPLLFSKLNPINKGTPVTFYGPPQCPY